MDFASNSIHLGFASNSIHMNFASDSRYDTIVSTGCCCLEVLLPGGTALAAIVWQHWLCCPFISLVTTILLSSADSLTTV